MSDQPPTDKVDGPDQHSTDQPTISAWLPLEDAAARLGISENAVRQRIKRGTVHGVKSDAGWFVDVSHRPTKDHPEGIIGRPQANNRPSRTTDHQLPIDLVPLTDLIDDLTRRNADLTAAAAMWQTRAAHLENEFKQLAASDMHPEADPVLTTVNRGSTASDQKPTGIRAWLRRLRGA